MAEMKNFLHDDMKTEIIAFLNSYSGGTIYGGVNDDGSVSSFSFQEKDCMELRVISWIRDVNSDQLKIGGYGKQDIKGIVVNLCNVYT